MLIDNNDSRAIRVKDGFGRILAEYKNAKATLKELGFQFKDYTLILYAAQGFIEEINGFRFEFVEE